MPLSQNSPAKVAPSRPGRPRGTSQRVNDDVLQATLALLLEGGSLKIEAIAERSGVHKTTLYRRWGNIDELVKAAIASVDMGELEFEDTGSLAGDVLMACRRFAMHFQKPEIISINRFIAGNRSSDNQLGQLMDDYWAGRHQLYRQMIDRAEARGEPVKPEQFSLAIEIIVGPMLLRSMMTDTVIDEALIQQISHSALDCLQHRGRPPTWPRID
jgi:AcrR family transcriptional regulator